LSTGGQTGKADYVKALSSTPTVSFSQLFVDAHKEINRVEQAKTILPVIDVEAERPSGAHQYARRRGVEITRPGAIGNSTRR